MVCQIDNNKFAVSVANALLFDETCGGEQLILSAKTLINSSITQAIQATTVYGGKGSQSEFEFNYQKEITVNLEDSVFSPVYLAVQNGTNIVQELTKFYNQEDITLDDQGVGTLTGTPVGNVQVGLEDGTFTTVLATGKTVTIPTMAGKTIGVVYAEEGTMDTISIDSSTFPKALKLVLNIDIFDNNGKVEEMQITIHKFKPDGNLDISLTHDGVATSSLAGKALTSCGEYAKIAFKKVAQAQASCFSAIVATPETIEFSVAATTEPVTLSVIGVRGGMYGNVTLDNTTLTFTSSDEEVVTVDANGVVTMNPTVVAPAEAEVTIETADGLKDTVTIEVVA